MRVFSVPAPSLSGSLAVSGAGAMLTSAASQGASARSGHSRGQMPRVCKEEGAGLGGQWQIRFLAFSGSEERGACGNERLTRAETAGQVILGGIFGDFCCT